MRLGKDIWRLSLRPVTSPFVHTFGQPGTGLPGSHAYSCGRSRSRRDPGSGALRESDSLDRRDPRTGSRSPVEP